MFSKLLDMPRKEKNETNGSQQLIYSIFKWVNLKSLVFHSNAVRSIIKTGNYCNIQMILLKRLLKLRG